MKKIIAVMLLFLCFSFVEAVMSRPKIDLTKPFAIYVKKTEKPPISTGGGDAENNELWLKQSELEMCIVHSRSSPDIKKIIAGISNPQIAPDRKYIYFMSMAWAVSQSVHKFDLVGWKESYVCPGNSLQVIQDGKYKGNIIVSQHRYGPAPEYGSYDHDYILDKNGKEIKDLGESSN